MAEQLACSRVLLCLMVMQSSMTFEASSGYRDYGIIMGAVDCFYPDRSLRYRQNRNPV